MTRTEFSRRTKVDAFTRADGRCECCGARLSVGKFEYDHIVSCSLGGDNSLDNCRVICRPCHKIKTRDDIRKTRKADRVKAAHIGAKKRKGKPMPGTKASRIRKRMDGSVERW